MYRGRAIGKRVSVCVLVRFGEHVQAISQHVGFTSHYLLTHLYFLLIVSYLLYIRVFRAHKNACIHTQNEHNMYSTCGFQAYLEF